MFFARAIGSFFDRALEGAAMGKPSIATNVPGCRDVVEDKFTGYLCEVRSATSLADAMFRMLALTPNELLTMGRRGREKVEREFDIALVSKAYLDALR